MRLTNNTLEKTNVLVELIIIITLTINALLSSIYTVLYSYLPKNKQPL